METLLTHLKNLRDTYYRPADHLRVQPNEALDLHTTMTAVTASHAWQKLDHYYGLFDDSHAYAAAIAVQPYK